MKPLRFAALLALICVTMLAACDSASDNPNQAGPTAPANTNDAEKTAETFLTGWVNNDYPAMYALLSPKSLLMNLDSFSKIYKAVELTLRVKDKGKSFEIKHDQTVRQGTTVAITYNMTFDTGSLGKFTDENRTIRLILSGGKWRVAWSQMDIFEGIAGGATLNVELTQSTRGKILDRNQQVIAQSGIPNYAVRLLTRKYPTGKAEDCFKKLGEVFRVKASDLNTSYGSLTGQDFGFTVGTLSEGDYKNLKPELDAACLLEYRPQTTRVYYGGSFASQTVGFIGGIPGDDLGSYPQYSPDALVGRKGVEQYWEKQLAGEGGARLVISAPDGTELREIASKKPGAAQDVTLTLDRDLQIATERAIGSATSAANWGQFSTGAAAVVLDANTGDILAIASYPIIQPDSYLPTTTFDVQTALAAYNKQRAELNRATQETYAAGSVFKIVSTAAAAGSGTVKMSDKYTCTGIWDGTSRNDIIRKDWIYLDKYAEKPYHGTITLEQALTSSCDAYYWEVGSKLEDIDPGLFKKYANDMGLGVKTGVDLLEEQSGNIPDPDWKFKTLGKRWGLGDSLNTVIGQGDVKVTPIQVARMMAAVANGGTLYHPHFVQSVGLPGQPPTYVANPPAPTPPASRPESTTF
ncbi:MAG: penicillin-binding transpeptidase domain-containing protein, partial [Chloroflexota bacterium]